ncbi:MAG: 50S ribosomal protein L25 [Candidatus Flexifilum sp.]
MAETYTLDAQKRTLIGKQVGQLRRAGIIPAVVYGARTAPIHVQIDAKQLKATLLKAGGTHLITMNIEGRSQQVIARDVQRDVIRGDILHVDFLAVDASTKVRTEVPIAFVGEAPAVQMGMGILLQGLSTLEIEALPADLVERIEVDLSPLKSLNDSIHVRDLKLGDKLTVVTDPDAMIVRVTVTSAAVSEAAAELEERSAEPEVIEKGKKQEEFED